MTEFTQFEEPTIGTEDKSWLSGANYDRLKKLVQVVLPAVAALYFGLAGIWNLPNAEQIVGTIAVVTTFLGVFLTMDAKRWAESDAAYDGQMNIIEGEDGTRVFSLDLSGSPEVLETSDVISFRVNQS